ncbi:MAG: hypothetical protein AAF415_12655 [Pseudomonadota bacterium]
MPHRPDPRLTIRLTPEEYAEIKAKAGAKPLATFARELLLAKADRRRNAQVRAVMHDQAAYARILAMLGASAAVQAFRDAVRGTSNGTLPTSKDIEASLDAVVADIAEIKRLLMQALGVAER